MNGKIIITGASGVIGKALEKELKSAGYTNVIPLTSKHIDLQNSQQTVTLFEQIKPEIVFHLAARVYGIMGNMANKAKAYIENIKINSNVIEAAYRAGTRKIVAMGSSAIYSDNVPLPMSETDIWSGAPHHSEAAYAHAKRSMLAQLEAYYDQYGIEFAFCISTNLYGPHDRFDEKWGHVIPSLISKFYHAKKNNEDVTVWGSGSACRDFLFSEDAAHALRVIAEQYNGPINLATGQSHTIKETVEIIRDVSGFNKNIIWDTTKPNGQELRKYNVEKLNALGFTINNSLEQGLRKTYEWYCSNTSNIRC